MTDDFLDYDPMSEEDALRERYKLLEDGIYRATIQLGEGKISSSGNPMGVFILRVYDHNGKAKEITDYIPFIPSMIWKLRHLCDSAGLIKEFEAKKFKPNLANGLNVFVSIKTQSGNVIPIEKLNGKPEGSKYLDKNIIEDYLMTQKGALIEDKSDSKGHADLPFDDVISF